MHPRLFLLRHGRSLANERGLIASSPSNAGEAFGLTEVGRAQVHNSLVEARADSLGAPVLLISSPLLRARESLDVATELLGVAPTIDARLSERGFGDFELQPDARYEQVWAKDRLDATHRSWGVESVVDVHRRVSPLIDELNLQGGVTTVILCTHGDVASVLICASLGIPLERHREVGGLETGALRELTSHVE